MNYVCTRCGRITSTGVEIKILSCSCGKNMVDYKPEQLELKFWKQGPQEIYKKLVVHTHDLDTK